MRILIIEDDRQLAQLIRTALTGEGFNTDISHDGDTGLEMALRGIYDIAIVDWMLPGRDGPSICRAIRAAQLSTGLIILTARGQIEDRVAGLDSGADDYLVKPFAFDELLARIRALDRRFNPGANNVWELSAGDIVLDLHAHTARRGTKNLELTKREWDLLEYMMRHPGQSLTRQNILDYVWSYENDVQVELVDVYISYLRHKLNQSGAPDPIQTVRGIGYRFITDHT
jgi:two-component system OmpR family response regulator